ncbi:MAG TPA: prepilin peptidase [Methylocella sp.]|nr:prepilin peptidase [Methylocella sp.]
MPLPLLLDAATLSAFPALMAFAAICDFLTMTIPNRVSIALAGLFLMMALACRLSVSVIALHFACGAAMLLVTFAMFSRGWIGGGDAKLAATTAIWLGFDHLGDYALIASLLGGLLTVAILGLRQWPWPVRGWHVFDPAAGIPYGVALAAAGLLVYPSTAIWLATASFH